MAIPAGRYALGPDDGTLSVRTQKTGAAAMAGHNLLFHVGSWEAVLVVGDDPADTVIEGRAAVDRIEREFTAFAAPQTSAR